MTIEIITKPVGPLQANCYCICDPEAGNGVVIDPGGDPDIIMQTLENAGAKCSAILITHGHHDHIGGVAGLKAATAAPVYGSAEARMVLSDPDRFQLFPGMPICPSCLIDNVLAGGETIDAGDIEVEAIATPGHSRGSITYLIAGCLFTGDLLFHGSIGRTDLPGGSFDELAASVKNLILRYPPDTKVFAGHGNQTTLATERENNPFLTDLGW